MGPEPHHRRHHVQRLAFELRRGPVRGVRQPRGVAAGQPPRQRGDGRPAVQGAPADIYTGVEDLVLRISPDRGGDAADTLTRHSRPSQIARASQYDRFITTTETPKGPARIGTVTI